MPYLIYLASNFNHFTQIFLELGQKTFIFRSSAAKIPLQLVSTNGFNDLTVLYQSYNKFNAGVMKITALDYLPRALLIIGIFYSLLKSDPVHRTLGIYAAFGLAYIFLSNSQIFPHYYNAQLPVYFILLSLPLASVLEKYKGVLQGSTAVFITVLISYQLLFSVSFLRFIAGEECIWSEYGPPYRIQVERMRDIVEAIDDQEPAPDLQFIYENIKECVNWDILATDYLYEKISGKSSDYIR